MKTLGFFWAFWSVVAAGVGTQTTEYWQRLDESLTRHGARVYLQERVRGEQVQLREREIQFRILSQLHAKKAVGVEEWEVAKWNLAVQRLELEKMELEVKIVAAYAEISELEVKEQAGESIDVKALKALYETLGRSRCEKTKIEANIAQVTADHTRALQDRRQRLYHRDAASYSELLQAETQAGRAMAELKGRLATQKICKDFLKDPNPARALKKGG